MYLYQLNQSSSKAIFFFFSHIQDFDNDSLYLVIGKAKLNIRRVEQHPDYKKGSFLANLALVELDRTVDGVKPVFLPCGTEHR